MNQREVLDLPTQLFLEAEVRKLQQQVATLEQQLAEVEKRSTQILGMAFPPTHLDSLFD